VSVPVIAFFNNKGGVGKTSLVYHLAWMYADLGVRVLAADLDPQANLTSAFADEDCIQRLWSEDGDRPTIFGCLQPLVRGVGDIADARLEKVNLNLALVPGDLSLSSFEDELSSQWPDCLGRKERAFRVVSSLWRVLQQAAMSFDAHLVLVDLGPNLGAINRASLIAADFVVIPLSPDLFSLQGLRNLGPAFRRWRSEWKERLDKNPVADLPLPSGSMKPLGYVVLQHAVRLDRPAAAYGKWISRIPDDYSRFVLDQVSAHVPDVETDPNKLALLKHYRSLMPMAQEARKPIFHLRTADGAIGAHLEAVQQAGRDFKALASEISRRADLTF
jgi:chromosome partitioning protein